MSIGQVLLTVGVALWVFDVKKNPKLVSDFAAMVCLFQRYYQRVLVQWDAFLQQQNNQQTLTRNELKAKQAETSLDK